MVVLLLACTSDPVDSSPPVDSPTPIDSPVDTHVERPALVSPAEAEDLDPDEDVVHVKLTATVTEHGYAYNGQVPGPTIRAKRGDTILVEFQNDLESPSTIHWHGLHVPFEMDGVAWMGAPIEAGGSFTYTFTVDQVGTYWYHPHFDTESQVDLGLYGVFLVEDPEAPEMEELVVVFDAGDEVTGDDHHHPEGTRLEWTVNGVVDGIYTGEGPIRVRALNASNTGYVALRSPGKRIASDQGWIEHDELDLLVLGPGDRTELEWTGDRDLITAPYSLNGGEALGEDIRLFSVEGLSGEPVDWPALTEAPTPDPGVADIVYVFQGGPEGWFINGETFPDVTIEEIPVGQPTVVEVRNLSPSHHPFHLHGMGFELLSMNGVPPATKTVEDNLDIPLYSTARVLLNPPRTGDWMTHCHILPHADGGMMTVLRVVE